MSQEKLIAGIALASIGLLFFFNNENIAKGAAKLYQKLYTEKNLKVIFKILGIFLIIGGIIINIVE
jgi:hypothetical protein